MKKIALLLLAVVSLASCSEEITRNSPAMEGQKDGVRWRGRNPIGTIGTGGSVILTASNEFETLTLQLPSTNPGTYELGTSGSRTANFSISASGGGARSWSTGVGRGDGEIVVTSYNEVTHKITGTFRFNAIDDTVDEPEEGTDDVLNFQYGNFYEVQVTPAAP